MIFDNTTAENWCKRYPGLEVISDNCPKCGQSRVADRPVALLGSYRGLISSPHACGPQFDLLTAVSVDKVTNSQWLMVAQSAVFTVDIEP